MKEPWTLLHLDGAQTPKSGLYSAAGCWNTFVAMIYPGCNGVKFAHSSRIQRILTQDNEVDCLTTRSVPRLCSVGGELKQEKEITTMLPQKLESSFPPKLAQYETASCIWSHQKLKPTHSLLERFCHKSFQAEKSDFQTKWGGWQTTEKNYHSFAMSWINLQKVVSVRPCV